MKFISGSLAVAGAITGLLAAWYWYRSSSVQIEPPGVSGDPQITDTGWLVGTMGAIADAGALNATAARWTAASVVLCAVSTLVGNLG